jgi:hypothetical protein
MLVSFRCSAANERIVSQGRSPRVRQTLQWRPITSITVAARMIAVSTLRFSSAAVRRGQMRRVSLHFRRSMRDLMTQFHSP